MNLSLCDLDHLRQTLVGLLSSELRLAEAQVQTSRPLTEYGLDSIAALTIAGELEERFSIELPPTLLWDHPTIDHIAGHLHSMLQSSAARSA